jgi:hypothetical protein
MTDSIHFLLPGLLSPGIELASTMPALWRLLSKADSIERHQCLESRLNELLSLDTLPHFPFAAFSALALNLASNPSPHWMKADLASLQAGPQGVVMMDWANLTVSNDERAQIERALSPLFQEYGFEFKLLAEGGFVSMPCQPDMTTNTLLDVVGKNLYQRLPSGPEGAKWQKILTECQMILQTLPLNVTRIQNGHLPINTVWFWGEGQLPTQINCPFDRLISDEIFVKGVGDLSHTQTFAIPKEFNLKNFSGHSLCVSFVFQMLVRHGQLESWKNLVTHWDRTYFQSVLNCLKKGEIGKIVIEVGDGRIFTIKTRYLNYFWRRKQYVTHSEH